MSDPIKILFDENFGEPLVSALAEVIAWYEGDVEIRHLFHFAKSGEKDESWVPKIAAQNWIVVSADRGKRCGGRKLPHICRTHGVTHILLSAGLCQAKRFEKMRAIISVWPKIVLAAEQERGKEFLLRYEGSEKRVSLIEVHEHDRIKTTKSMARLEFSGRKKRSRATQRKKRVKPIPPAERIFREYDGT